MTSRVQAGRRAAQRPRYGARPAVPDREAVADLCERVARLEVAVFGEPAPIGMGEARRAFLAKAKEKRG